MPDRKLEYWYDWEIYGPDGNCLVSLRESIPSIDTEKLSGIDYLCERINDYPDATFMEESFWYEISMLTRSAFKDEKIFRGS